MHSLTPLSRLRLISESDGQGITQTLIPLTSLFTSLMRQVPLTITTMASLQSS
jgi:hypothetical protein